jgi:hypothetical protein
MAAPVYERYRFSVEDYHRMGEAGIFSQDARVELIDGEIVAMSAIGLRHLSCVDRLAALLGRSLAPRTIVRIRGSIRLGDRSEPQPDLVLLKPRGDFYRLFRKVMSGGASRSHAPRLSYPNNHIHEIMQYLIVNIKTVNPVSLDLGSLHHQAEGLHPTPQGDPSRHAVAPTVHVAPQPAQGH